MSRYKPYAFKVSPREAEALSKIPSAQSGVYWAGGKSGLIHRAMEAYLDRIDAAVEVLSAPGAWTEELAAAVDLRSREPLVTILLSEREGSND